MMIIIIMQKGRWDMSPLIPPQSTPISLRSRKWCSNLFWMVFRSPKFILTNLIKRNVLPFYVLHFCTIN